MSALNGKTALIACAPDANLTARSQLCKDHPSMHFHLRRSFTRWGLLLSAVVWLAACAGKSTTTMLAPTGTPTATPYPVANTDQVTLKHRAGVMDPNAAIDRIISHLTLDEKIAQMQ